jgi:hypothetical protein
MEMEVWCRGGYEKLMLKQFAEKERLKDHLLYIIKQTGNSISAGSVEPASDILMNVFDVYEEISEEEGKDASRNYSFNIMASYVLLSIELIYMNKRLIKTNIELIEKLEDQNL